MTTLIAMPTDNSLISFNLNSNKGTVYQCSHIFSWKTSNTLYTAVVAKRFLRTMDAPLDKIFCSVSSSDLNID